MSVGRVPVGVGWCRSETSFSPSSPIVFEFLSYYFIQTKLVYIHFVPKGRQSCSNAGMQATRWEPPPRSSKLSNTPHTETCEALLLHSCWILQDHADAAAIRCPADIPLGIITTGAALKRKARKHSCRCQVLLLNWSRSNCNL
eukprot:1161143-Pelagomonas_calceolata.AAC.3